MSKRATIHLPAERHQLLREIASRRGHATISEFLDAFIAAEAKALGLDASIVRVTTHPSDPGAIAVEVMGLPEFKLRAEELEAAVRDLDDVDYRGWRLWWRELASGQTLEFRRRGKGYSLTVREKIPAKTAWGFKWQPHTRGLTVALADEFVAALKGAAKSGQIAQCVGQAAQEGGSRP